jgi:hypothetical protein
VLYNRRTVQFHQINKKMKEFGENNITRYGVGVDVGVILEYFANAVYNAVCGIGEKMGGTRTLCPIN